MPGIKEKRFAIHAGLLLHRRVWFSQKGQVAKKIDSQRLNPNQLHHTAQEIRALFALIQRCKIDSYIAVSTILPE
jgi:hypothetical protein